MVTARSSNLLGKITVVVVICCLVMGIFVVNTVLALDGSGTQEDPWLIRSLEDFNDFAADANYWAGFTRLETDVNLAGIVYERAVIAPDVNDVDHWFQGIAFAGVFDGNDHKIMNLNIDDGGVRNECLGLFGYIDNGEVGNLGVEGNSVSGYFLVGGLVGMNDGSISNCYFTGDVNSIGIVGGLVGLNENGNVSNCYSTGDVSGEGEVGGLVGRNHGSISNCYSTGDVSGVGALGGLVGINYYGSISNCYSTSDVSGDDDVGGLVGDNLFSSVSYCYSTGNVSGENEIGGLVGNNNQSSLSKCYSIGDVNGVDVVGGLVGGNLFNCNISNCYSTGDVSGRNEVGGLVGANLGIVSYCYSTGGVSGRSDVGGLVGDGFDITNSYWDIETSEQLESDGGTGKTTAEMQTMNTFTDADWDFINVWNIGENQTYPYLRVYLPSDINQDGIVNFLDVAITANQWMEGVE